MLEPKPLTSRQQDVYDVIARYNRVTGEPCSASYLGRRFEIHHSRAQELLEILFRKGWLHGPNSPAKARRWLVKRQKHPADPAPPQSLRGNDTPQP
jgi:SOS-response transcriptional repressor LexA